MAEVEDVARPAPCAREHVERALFDAVPRAEQGCGIEVALHAAFVADDAQPRSSAMRQSSADHIASCARERAEQILRHAGAEVNRRNVGRVEDACGVRRDELVVVGGRERADPRVEELDHIGTGLCLRAHVTRELLREQLEERVPRVWLRYINAFVRAKSRDGLPSTR